MRPLILLSAILIPFLYAQDWCCPRKNVGGKVYNLVSSDVDGSKWGCSDNCAYAMEGDMNMTRKFCFRPGKFESKCDSDFTGMPGGGSMGTGMPGGGGMTTGMPGGGGMTGGAGGASPSPNPTSGPNPGGPAETKTLTISQTWSQEQNGYERTAELAIPETAAGEKVPVVIHLHGNGGQGNTIPFGNFLGDKCIIVAPNGYERSWNVYAEKSKADDVQFVLDLIAKIAEEVPQADMNNVNIAGSSNGAALTYQLLINTGADRPFKRAFPMVSSMIGPQYNNDKFWKFSMSASDGNANDFDTEMNPTFSTDFEYAHFHGTNDGAIAYEGQNPGPAFLNNAEVIAAQLTDYIWAKAMGYTGAQIPDADGVSVGTAAKPTSEYKYLDGRCRHYKLIDEGHNTGPSHPIVQQVVREMILGPGV